MAGPAHGVTMSGAGGVQVALRPPIEFILRQSGAFRRELSNLNPLWDRFKPVMSAIEQEQWDSAGHGEWVPLADSTVRQKGHSEILVDTGDLRASLVDPNRAADTGPRHMSWGTDIEYAHWHQDGGGTAGRPPKRPILDLRAEDRRKLETEQVAWLNDVAAKTWGRI